MKLNELYMKDGLYYNKYTDNLFSGRIDEGEKFGTFKNGLKHGFWKEYVNNKLSATAIYKEGKLDRECMFYMDELGHKKTLYKANEKIYEEEFDKNSNLKIKTFYESDERKTVEYYEDGKLIKQDDLF